MVNVTNKSNTLRQAMASAVLKVSKQETIDAIQQNKVAKGDVFEFSRAAGLLAVKKTSDVIPDCHPPPVKKTANKTPKLFSNRPAATSRTKESEN